MIDTLGQQNQIRKLAFLDLLRQLRLVQPETYAKTLADHFDPMVQVQWEMEKMNGIMSAMLDRAFLGADLPKAEGKDLERIHEMMGLGAFLSHTVD
jgi:hypothetical protein